MREACAQTDVFKRFFNESAGKTAQEAERCIFHVELFQDARNIDALSPRELVVVVHAIDFAQRQVLELNDVID